MGELALCPICGATVCIWDDNEVNNYWFIECPHCGLHLRGEVYGDREALVTLWNRRPLEQELGSKLTAQTRDTTTLYKALRTILDLAATCITEHDT